MLAYKLAGQHIVIVLGDSGTHKNYNKIVSCSIVQSSANIHITQCNSAWSALEAQAEKVPACDTLEVTFECQASVWIFGIRYLHSSLQISQDLIEDWRCSHGVVLSYWIWRESILNRFHCSRGSILLSGLTISVDHACKLHARSGLARSQM